MDERKAAKWAAAQGALELVRREYRAGMVLGLGTGSTAELYVEQLAKVVQAEGWSVSCVTTSSVIARYAKQLGLPLEERLLDFPRVDITVDGADEIDPLGNLTKGGGGALLREKYVALASEKMVVIVDADKHVEALGTTFKLPVEICPFGWNHTVARLQGHVKRVQMRLAKGSDSFFETDQHNYIADCECEAITDPASFHSVLKSLPGVVETGIFPGIAFASVTGRADGTWESVTY